MPRPHRALSGISRGTRGVLDMGVESFRNISLERKEERKGLCSGSNSPFGPRQQHQVPGVLLNSLGLIHGLTKHAVRLLAAGVAERSQAARGLQATRARSARRFPTPVSESSSRWRTRQWKALPARPAKPARIPV